MVDPNRALRGLLLGALLSGASSACTVEIEGTDDASLPTAQEVGSSDLAANGSPPDSLAFATTHVELVDDGTGIDSYELRKGPDLTFPVVADLPVGTSVAFTGLAGASPSGSWIEVEVPTLGVTGFVPYAAVGGIDVIAQATR